MKELPSQARVVIIGGGIVGVSVAYHLTKLGWQDVVLLERKQLTCGTTWHAAGLLGQLRNSLNMTRLAQYTADLYSRLEEETGQNTGIKQNGSISIATNSNRLHELRRQMSTANAFGLEIHEISPGEIKERWPLLNVEDVIGGIYIPQDGTGNPIDTTMALAKGAKAGGAQIFENTCVIETLVNDDKAVGVVTDRGTVKADFVVNCTGLWAWELGEKSNVTIPLHGCEHFYIVTDNIPGLSSDLPSLRALDDHCYYKEDAGKLLLGAFEPRGKPWGGAAGIPADFCFDELPEDMDHFAPILEQAMHRVPVLEETGIRMFFNGPESFTPDVRYLLGETPNLKNYFVAAGFNSTGFQSAGGAGKVLAEWIVKGHAPMDLWDIDIRRMQPFQMNAKYLCQRVSESIGRHYSMHWPFHQPETSRDVRTSALHDRLKDRGACFGEAAGWERANWFATEGQKPEYEYSWGRQNWFPNWHAEHMATRTGVALFDQTSFNKFYVQGRDVVSVLQNICANDVNVDIGRIVYTQWLNERGGIESDLTVTRVREDAYLVVTGSSQGVRDEAWLNRHIPTDAFVTVTNVTSAYSVLGLMGPNSRRVLSKLTRTDLSNEAFPFATSKNIEIGYGHVRAHRITYVGELGWELYIPTEFSTGIFDAIMDAGESDNLMLGGMHAIDSLRSEKAYRHWGHDITDEYTPLEAGLGFACKLNSDVNFIGRDALLRQKEKPLDRRLVSFILEDAEPLLFHDEPIYRDGVNLGRISSGSYGHFLGAAVGMGYLSNPDGVSKEFVDSGSYEIEIAGERVPAKASLRPLYDPKSDNIKK